MIIGMFIVYFIISVFTYIVFAQDKQKAIEARWRTPEKGLILLMIFGGSPGAFVAMKAQNPEEEIAASLGAIAKCGGELYKTVYTKRNRKNRNSFLLTVRKLKP